MTRTVNTYNKKLSLIFIIVFVITLSGLVIGCGGDDNELDLLYNLHSALVLTHFGIFTTNPCHERIRTG